MDSSGGQLLYAAAGNQAQVYATYKQNTQETISNNNNS